jgi:uridine kinase
MTENMKGICIDITGPDGSGKSVIAEALKSLLQTSSTTTITHIPYKVKVIYEATPKYKEQYKREFANLFDVTIFDGEFKND